MRKVLKYVLAALAVSVLLPGCMVHEFPQGEVDVKVIVHLQFPSAITPYKTVTKADEDGSFRQLRYIVRAYQYSIDAWDSRAKGEVIEFSTVFSSLDRTVELILPAGKYRFGVWVDYTDESGEDLYWAPGGLEKVTFAAPYLGGARYREAFCGREVVDFSEYNASGLEKEVVINMTRPLGGYELVANDKEEFITKFAKAADDATKATYDFTGYTVRIDYKNFFPTVYDVRRDANVDSRTGMYFTVPLYERGEEVVMGHDLVLADEEETSVVVDMTMFDASGLNLGTVKNISIPLIRGGLTTVRGTLLTSGTVSGVRIDPTFDGDFNIPLQ